MYEQEKVAKELLKIAKEIIGQGFKPLKKNKITGFKVSTKHKTPFYAELKNTSDKKTEYNVFAKVNGKYYLVSRVGWHGEDDPKRASEEIQSKLKSVSVDKLKTLLEDSYNL